MGSRAPAASPVCAFHRTHVSVAELKEAARVASATVNDVLLAALFRAFAAFAQGKGKPAKEVSGCARVP